MIYLLYGEDTYRSRQKLNQIKEEFSKKDSGSLNLISLAGEDLDLARFRLETSSLPFLSEKRLVIVENLFLRGLKETIKEIIDFLPHLPETADLVFYEQDKLDEKFINLFKKIGQVFKFNLLEGDSLARWIEEEVKREGGKIERAAVDRLAIYVGNDLWQMSNEIKKLIAFKYEDDKKEPVILQEDVGLLTKANFNATIFNLIDALGNKNSRKTLSLLVKFLETGEAELSILGMITYQFRNLLIIKDLVSQGLSFEAMIKKTHLHPFVVRKTIRQSKNFSQEELKKIYQKLLDCDLAIKTGQVEPDLALELLVVGLCGG